MTDTLINRLKIGDVELPIDTHHLGCTVQITRDATGRRRIHISATGTAPPDVSGIPWSAPVSVSWRDLSSDTGGWSSLAILSPGIQRTDDLMSVPLAVSWSLGGIEAAETGGPVTIGGVAYWGIVSSEILAGGSMVQRKTVGAGTLLKSWTRHRVSIRGESVSPPAISVGVIAVVSGRYTGLLLVTGISASDDQGTGLVSWSIVGEEP